MPLYDWDDVDIAVTTEMKQLSNVDIAIFNTKKPMKFIYNWDF